MPATKEASPSLSHAKACDRLFNRILAMLPEGELDDVSRHARAVLVRREQVLYQPGAPISHAYFLNSGLDSIVAVMNDGRCTEVALTGREGFLGAPLLLGVDSMPYRAVVQVPGEAFAIRARAFQEIVERNRQFRALATRFVQAHTIQVMQTAACNRLHDAEQRLGRWLLLAQDRLGSQHIPLTQEFLAMMLGLRRESVVVTIQALEQRGAVDGHRGLLTISDRDALERSSCECYRVVRNEFDRLLFRREID